MTFPAQAKSAEGDTESYCHSPTLVDVANIDNLYQGFLNARRTKRNKKAIWDFENNLGQNLTTISKALFDNTYVPDEPRTFIIHEKKRREPGRTHVSLWGEKRQRGGSNIERRSVHSKRSQH